MSLILTIVSDFGIVQLSDSRIVVYEINTINGVIMFTRLFHDNSQKTFRFEPFPVLMASAGSYSINSIALPEWINNFFQANNEVVGIQQLSNNLITAIEQQMLAIETNIEGITFDIAGYKRSDNGYIPQVWRVSNRQMDTNLINPDGFTCQLVCENNNMILLGGESSAINWFREIRNQAQNPENIQTLEDITSYYKDLLSETINNFTNANNNFIIGGEVQSKTIRIPNM